MSWRRVETRARRTYPLAELNDAGTQREHAHRYKEDLQDQAEPSSEVHAARVTLSIGALVLIALDGDGASKKAETEAATDAEEEDGAGNRVPEYFLGHRGARSDLPGLIGIQASTQRLEK